MKYFGKERQMLEQDLNQLGELMLRTVSSNPIDLTERSVMITNIITDYVYKEIESPILSVLLAQRRWSFDWTTLKRSNGVLLLEFLFVFTWSNTGVRWIH